MILTNYLIFQTKVVPMIFDVGVGSVWEFWQVLNPISPMQKVGLRE